MISANITRVQFGGQRFEFGDVVLIIPALSTRQVREHYDLISNIAGEVEEGTPFSAELVRERLDAKLALILLAVTRNYPGAVMDDLLDFVELGDLDKLLMAVLGRSLSPKTKVLESGEIKPVA